MKFLRIALVVILFSLNSIFLFAIFQTQVQAQIVCNPADRNQGLVSSVGLNGTFGNPTGQCVIDQKAAYVNFKVPNYNELKSVFFTQNSSSIKTIIDSISTPGCTGGNTVYLKNLVVSANLVPAGRTIFNVQCNFTHIADTDPTYGPLMTTGTQQTIVIFADNHLYIDTNLDYGGDQYGLVIVAKGDIYIAPTVTKINAVLVNEGNVVTSYTGGSISDLVANSQQLVINGSLINLSQSGQRIYFNRSLTDNNIPAEVVNFQPKFLVLLRGMMTQSYTIQREIGADEIPSASLFPSPTGIPSPSPVVNPGSTFGNAYCLFGVYDLLNTLNIASNTDVPCS